MGEAINSKEYVEEDYTRFSKKLRQETLLIKKLFDERKFTYSKTPHLGLEVEGWILDKNHMPNPINSKLIKKCDHELVVEELSQFNLELNTPPHLFQSGCFQNINNQLNEIWSHCENQAGSMGSTLALIGIHPMVREDMLELKYLSEGGRYESLNRQLLKLSNGKPFQIKIEGTDTLIKEMNHIMMEAAATSIQVHIEANQEDGARLYNASLLAATPTVALAANSPYLYGHDLWDETRIPLFEQSLFIPSFRDKKGQEVGRVTFGTGYARHSLLEQFLENLDGYPPLVPVNFEDSPENFRHLKFHNGTIWRWVRPILGFSGAGEPHTRIEQRVMASGPSIIDIVANVAFSVGLTTYYSKLEKPPEESMTFTHCKSNFYSAAKNGLQATVNWFGKDIRLDTLILEDLIDKSIIGLKQFGIEPDEIDHYINGVIKPRVMTGQNGAHWQRSFVGLHRKDMQALSEKYLENQQTQKPVHEWKL